MKTKTMKKYDLNHFVTRYIGEKILIINIKQNAVYEVDKSTSLCVEKIKDSDGMINYPLLSQYLGKDIETLKQEVPALLAVLMGDLYE